MKRPAFGMVYLLVFFLVSGCSLSDATKYVSRTQRPFHKVSETPATKAAAAEVCILDPVALAPEISSTETTFSDKAPVVEVPEIMHDFGKISEEHEFVHRFNVKNTGKSVLNIKKVLPG